MRKLWLEEAWEEYISWQMKDKAVLNRTAIESVLPKSARSVWDGRFCMHTILPPRASGAHSVSGCLHSLRTV